MAVNKVVLGSEVLLDLTSDTITADTLLDGYTAHDASGNAIIGTAASGSQYTGHVDAEGLADIGWTADDIEWLQNNVWWHEGADDFYLVNDESKQMWADYQNGDYVVPTVFTSNNSIGNSYPNINFCPKINTSHVTSLYYAFSYCLYLQTIPLLDTSNVTSLYYAFRNCYCLRTIPLIDTSNASTVYGAFYYCTALQSIPLIDTSNATVFQGMFYYCLALQSIPSLNMSKAVNLQYFLRSCTGIQVVPILDTSLATSMYAALYECQGLQAILMMDATNVSDMAYMLYNCSELMVANIKNVNTSFDISAATGLSYDSIMFIINNAKTVTSGTMTFGETNLAKITTNEKAIATTKGWTLA